MLKALFEKVKVFLAGKKSINNLRRLDLTNENLASELSKAEGVKIPTLKDDLESNRDWPKDKSTPVDFINIPRTNSTYKITEQPIVNFNAVNSDDGYGLAEHAFRMDDHADLPSKYLSSPEVDKGLKGILRN